MNRGDEEGMQLPCNLNFEEKKKHIMVLKNEMGLVMITDYAPLFLFAGKNCQVTACLPTYERIQRSICHNI